MTIVVEIIDKMINQKACLLGDRQVEDLNYLVPDKEKVQVTPNKRAAGLL